jgi:hypothetical protein
MLVRGAEWRETIPGALRRQAGSESLQKIAAEDQPLNHRICPPQSNAVTGRLQQEMHFSSPNLFYTGGAKIVDSRLFMKNPQNGSLEIFVQSGD